jgi:hypothetical protein
VGGVAGTGEDFLSTAPPAAAAGGRRRAVRFEEWLKAKDITDERDERGNYRSTHAWFAEDAWQAATEAERAKNADTAEQHTCEEDDGFGCRCQVNIAAAIREGK